MYRFNYLDRNGLAYLCLPTAGRLISDKTRLAGKAGIHGYLSTAYPQDVINFQFSSTNFQSNPNVLSSKIELLKIHWKL